jgi:hypothetical protein
MPLPPPAFAFARPPRPRKRRAPAPAPPPPPPLNVLVVAVTWVSNQAVDFQFNLPVTCDGGECPAIFVDMGGIVDYPRSSEQIAPAVVRFFWVDDLIDAGDAWVINEEPTQGLNLHGRTMPVPQGGVVG